MSGGGRDFKDPFNDLFREATGLSDADLERLLMGGPVSKGDASAGASQMAPGSRIEGTVIDLRGGEVLVELDGKTLGVVPEEEFHGQVPLPGERLRAQFERFDRKKGVAVLSVGGVRREILWEELRRGDIVEGMVTSVNKGGLALDVKGLRAFLPASQVARERVEDLSSFVGKKLRCEITEVNAAARNLVLSRRLVLDREAEELKGNALARLSEGEVLLGKVVRLNDHGAFIDLGGADGLIPASKLRAHLKTRVLPEPLREGQQVQVQVVRVDQEKGRISLDLKQVAADTWNRAVEGYAAGDEVTGWISRYTPAEVVVSIDEGLEGIIPEGYLHLLEPGARTGTILKATVLELDASRQRLLLKPVESRKP